MGSYDAASLIALWERGRELGPLSRGVMLAAAASSDSEAAVAEWPLGRREAALLRTHTAYFGKTMPVSVACPACGEELEFELDAVAPRSSTTRRNLRSPAACDFDRRRLPISSSPHARNLWLKALKGLSAAAGSTTGRRSTTTSSRKSIVGWRNGDAARRSVCA